METLLTSGSSFQRFLRISLRLLGVVVLMLIAFVASGMVIHVDTAQPSAADAQAGMRVMLLVCTINALILAYLALRSRGHGWKLVGALFLVQYGIETLMPQIETVVFNQALHLPAEQIVFIFVTGFLRAFIFAPLAVWLLGKFRPEANTVKQDNPLRLANGEWLKRLTLLALLYTVIYFLFGYFVAWQSLALRQFYSGSSELLGFVPHMIQTLRSDPWLAVVQFGRGYLWVLIVLPLVRMFKGGLWETCFALALALAVLLSDFILFPNPFMPEAVRMAHLPELLSSMALFGVLTGWILLRNRPAVTAL